MENKDITDTDQQQSTKSEKSQRPNENGQILVDGAVKIFDPKTKEIFVEVRT